MHYDECRDVFRGCLKLYYKLRFLASVQTEKTPHSVSKLNTAVFLIKLFLVLIRRLLRLGSCNSSEVGTSSDFVKLLFVIGAVSLGNCVNVVDVLHHDALDSRHQA